MGWKDKFKPKKFLDEVGPESATGIAAGVIGVTNGAKELIPEVPDVPEVSDISEELKVAVVNFLLDFHKYLHRHTHPINRKRS